MATHAGERVSWLLETVQGRSDGFMHVDSPLDGDNIAGVGSAEAGDLDAAIQNALV